MLAHWRTVKPAYRITLEDGRELIASGDHRFLTRRGWKHVTGAEQGRDRRPHLTLNDTLMGTCAFVAPPVHTDDYRRGYLCGVIRGDGHLGSYSYERPGRAVDDHHRFRLALADVEALWRARDFLADVDVETTEFDFHRATVTQRAITAIRTSARDKVETIRSIIAWPSAPTDDWTKGFLAGIFDAEGSYGQCIRIANMRSGDRELDGLLPAAARVLVDRRALAGEGRHVRAPAGRASRRSCASSSPSTQPSPASGRSTAPQSRPKPGSGSSRSSRCGGREQLYDITTGTGDFVANGVVSHNCFARPTHTYLDFDAGRDFEREIVVKVNAPEVLRAELARPSWKREHVALGTNTDPYQWVEGRYELMRGIWEALRDSGTPCSVLTKSPLLLRDLDLMLEIDERAGFAANLSVPTLDEQAWRATEPHTPHPRKRLEAVAELNRAGIRCGVLIAPLMPGINDDPRQVERILELAAEAGATEVGGIGLHLRGEVRDVFMDWLQSQRPDLVPRYERLYARGAYLPKAERQRLAALSRPGGRVPRRRATARRTRRSRAGPRSRGLPPPRRRAAEPRRRPVSRADKAGRPSGPDCRVRPAGRRLQRRGGSRRPGCGGGRAASRPRTRPSRPRARSPLRSPSR